MGLIRNQGRNYVFEREEDQSPKAVLGPFCLKSGRAQVYFYYSLTPKSGSAWASQASKLTTTLITYLQGVMKRMDPLSIVIYYA